MDGFARLDPPARPQIDPDEARRAIELAGAFERARMSAREVSAELGIDPATLVAAAEEAGLDGRDVLQAVARERLGARPEPHRADALIGPAVVTVDRDLPLDAPTALSELDDWMVGGHHLRRDRVTQRSGRWSRRGGLLASMTRSLRHATGEGQLGDANVEAVAVDTGLGSCAVRVSVDRSVDRRARGASGAATAMVGTGAAVTVAVLVSPFVLIATPIAIAAGAAVARSGKASADALEREVTRVVDAIEDERAPSALGTDLVQRTVGVFRRSPAPRRS